MAKNITGLGRGLGALIDTGNITTGGSSSISEVNIDVIKPNPNQPRTHFDDESITELASSIREFGVISPITLRKNDDNSYMIIAGERRFRASKLVGLRTIPAYIKTAADEQIMEMALIENIQREDLNAIEIALSFYKLIEEYKLTQDRLSERVGKKRTTIANYLRLLRLPADIQMGIRDKKIDMGHARTLLGLNDPVAQLALYNQILKSNISVRKLEEMVRNYSETGSFNPQKAASAAIVSLPEYDEIKLRLSDLFGANVKFTCNNSGKGSINIPFNNDDELAKILELLDKI